MPATARHARTGHGNGWSCTSSGSSAARPTRSRELADRDELERSLARLAPQQRALLVMHYYLGLPMQETADTLGWPLGTVKSRLYRTTNDLRATLDAEARSGSGGGSSR